MVEAPLARVAWTCSAEGERLAQTVHSHRHRICFRLLTLFFKLAINGETRTCFVLVYIRYNR